MCWTLIYLPHTSALILSLFIQPPNTIYNTMAKLIIWQLGNFHRISIVPKSKWRKTLRHFWRYKKLHHKSNLKSASNYLNFSIHLVNRILRPMVKKSAKLDQLFRSYGAFLVCLGHFPKYGTNWPKNKEKCTFIGRLCRFWENGQKMAKKVP